MGVSVYGNGGMNTEYKSGSALVPNSNDPQFSMATLPGTYGAGTAGINLAQLFINVSFAKKINAKHAFGGSLLLVGQRLIVQGVDNFEGFSLDPDNLSGNRKSDSYGAGLKVGYQGRSC